MLKPSYAELMDVLNENADESSNEVTSRYTIVIAAAKRARQLIDGDEPMVASPDGKPVSTAVKEIYENKIKIVPKGQGTVLDFNNKKQKDNLFEEDEKDIFKELESEKTNDEAEVISEDLFTEDDFFVDNQENEKIENEEIEIENTEVEE